MDALLEAITVLSVKLHLGIQEDDTSKDSQILSIRNRIAPLIIEDIFSKNEIYKLTANQRERAVYALSMIVAAEVIFAIALGGSIDAIGESEALKIGPISISGSSAGVMAGTNLQKRAREMRRVGEEILEELRILTKVTLLEWGAV